MELYHGQFLNQNYLLFRKDFRPKKASSNFGGINLVVPLDPNLLALSWIFTGLTLSFLLAMGYYHSLNFLEPLLLPFNTIF